MRRLMLGLAAMLVAMEAAAMQNEAVRILPDGSRKVELPPGPRHKGFQNFSRTADPWPAGGRLPSFVIDTERGPLECTMRWVDNSCRTYVPGRDRRPRAWVLKRQGTWTICPRRDSAARCTSYTGLPIHELQD